MDEKTKGPEEAGHTSRDLCVQGTSVPFSGDSRRLDDIEVELARLSASQAEAER